MINKISTGFLVLMALAYANTGLQTFLDPQAVFAQVDITLNTSSALSTVRAVYGGMHLVFGLFCGFAAFRMREAGLGLVALYTAGYVLGRLSSIALDGAPNAFILTWLGVEAFCFLVSVFLLKALGAPKMAQA